MPFSPLFSLELYMKIRNKLTINSIIILVLMAVISVTAVIGIKFIQKNIFALTQKSTPYQIKTLDNQRALQAHASNLLKLAGSESPEEYKLNSTQSNESLAEEIKTAEELVKLGSTSDYAADAISENTKLIQEMTQKRLLLQQETQAVVLSMRGNLSDAAKRLQGLDTSIRKLQQGASKIMVTNVNITSKENKQATSLAALRDGLKDLSIYVTRVAVTSDADAVEDMFENLAGTLNNMQVYIKLITWSEKQTGEDIAGKLAELVVKLTEAKNHQLKFLASRDASASAKAVQATKAAELDIGYIQTMARMEISKSKSNLDNSSEDMSASIVAFSDTNAILILSAGILFSSAVIDSQVNYSLAIKGLADFDRTVAAINSEFNRVDTAAQKLKGMLTKGKFKHETRLLTDSLAALATVKQGFLGKSGAAEKIKASMKNIDEVSKLNQRMKEMVAKQMLQSGKDVVSAQKSQESAVASVRKAVSTTIMLIFAISGIAVLASILLSRWIATSITAPIRELTTVAEGFGNGDFSIRMDESRKDEFGTLAAHFNLATTKLGEITTQLKGSINKLASNSQNLSTTAENLYNGAKAQASQTEQSVTAMTEISQTIMDVARNARDAASASKDALNMATSGNSVITKTVRGMHEIAASVKGAAATVGKLSENSDKIGEIVNTINDIADQTNLLALNAAIEAARAGEQGLGFSVVADEVRKLAQRTGEATHEIAGIIHEIQTDTGKSVSAMNAGQTRVEEGVLLTNEASHSLEAIVKASQLGVDMAQMIANATDDQSSASSEVSHGMEKIANITNELSNSTAEIKQASLELSGLANELNQMASWFKIRT